MQVRLDRVQEMFSPCFQRDCPDLGATLANRLSGHDTKVMKNAMDPPSKRSKIELIVDKIIFFMFGLLFSFCIIGGF